MSKDSIFFLLFFSCILPSCENNNLDGFWYFRYSEYIEHLGHFDIEEIIIIDSKNYLWEQKRIGDFSVSFKSEEEGRIIIKNKEIHLFPTEIKGQNEITGQMYDWGEKETKIGTRKYGYELNGQSLTLYTITLFESYNEKIFARLEE